MTIAGIIACIVVLMVASGVVNALRQPSTPATGASSRPSRSALACDRDECDNWLLYGSLFWLSAQGIGDGEGDDLHGAAMDDDLNAFDVDAYCDADACDFDCWD